MDGVFGILSRFAFAALLATTLALPAHAGDREKAKRIYDRIAGIPPNASVMAGLESAMLGTNPVCSGYALTGNDPGAECAAYIAMQDVNFYNVTLKNFAAPWTNRDQSVFVPLNDYSATVIGMIRDDAPFNELLSRDITYVGRTGVVSSGPAANNNDHYAQLEANNINLRDELEPRLQSSINGLPGAATAGVMTSRAASEAFFIAGTNRSALHFTTLNFMCMGMEDFRDVTAWPDRIRQDVTRSPGGDSNVFLTDCLGCHAGMDSLAGAFAFYDFDEGTQRLVHTPGIVQPKFIKDAGTFRTGYETLGDSWINYWRSGPNAYVGWNGPGSGQGAKSLGMELAQTRQFSECQVENVFEKVCYRTPNGDADNQAVQTIANAFEANNRSMQRIFAETAVYCMGN